MGHLLMGFVRTYQGVVILWESSDIWQFWIFSLLLVTHHHRDMSRSIWLQDATDKGVASPRTGSWSAARWQQAIIVSGWCWLTAATLLPQQPNIHWSYFSYYTQWSLCLISFSQFSSQVLARPISHTVQIFPNMPPPSHPGHGDDELPQNCINQYHYRTLALLFWNI